MTDTEDDGDTCVYCDCPTSNHDCTGCLTEGCPCGYDGDWHPDPPRGDE
jgi:hypothetical protein